MSSARMSVSQSMIERVSAPDFIIGEKYMESVVAWMEEVKEFFSQFPDANLAQVDEGLHISDVLEGITLTIFLRLIPNIGNYVVGIRKKAIKFIVKFAEIFNPSEIKTAIAELQAVMVEFDNPSNGFESPTRRLFCILGKSFNFLTVALLAGAEALYSHGDYVVREIALVIAPQIATLNHGMLSKYDQLCTLWNILYLLAPLPKQNDTLSQQRQQQRTVDANLTMNTFAPACTALVTLLSCPEFRFDDEFVTEVLSRCLRLPDKSAYLEELVKKVVNTVFDRIFGGAVPKSTARRAVQDALFSLMNTSDENAHDMLYWAASEYCDRCKRYSPESVPPDVHDMLSLSTVSLRAPTPVLRQGAAHLTHSVLTHFPDAVRKIDGGISQILVACLDPDFTTSSICSAILRVIAHRQEWTDVVALLKDTTFDKLCAAIDLVGKRTRVTLPGGYTRSQTALLQYAHPTLRRRILRRLGVVAQATASPIDPATLSFLVSSLKLGDREFQLGVLKTLEQLAPAIGISRSSKAKLEGKDPEVVAEYLKTSLRESLEGDVSMLRAGLRVLKAMPLYSLSEDRLLAMVPTLFLKIAFSQDTASRILLYRVIGSGHRVWASTPALRSAAFTLLLLSICDKDPEAVAAVLDELDRWSRLPAFADWRNVLTLIQSHKESLGSSSLVHRIPALAKLSECIATLTECKIIRIEISRDIWLRELAWCLQERQPKEACHYTHWHAMVLVRLMVGLPDLNSQQQFSRPAASNEPDANTGGGSEQPVEGEEETSRNTAAVKDTSHDQMAHALPADGSSKPSFLDSPEEAKTSAVTILLSYLGEEVREYRLGACCALVRLCFIGKTFQPHVIRQFVAGIVPFFSVTSLAPSQARILDSALSVLQMLLKLGVVGSARLVSTIVIDRCLNVIDTPDTVPLHVLRRALTFVEVVLCVAPWVVGRSMQRLRDGVRSLMSSAICSNQNAELALTAAAASMEAVGVGVGVSVGATPGTPGGPRATATTPGAASKRKSDSAKYVLSPDDLCRRDIVLAISRVYPLIFTHLPSMSTDPERPDMNEVTIAAEAKNCLDFLRRDVRAAVSAGDSDEHQEGDDNEGPNVDGGDVSSDPLLSNLGPLQLRMIGAISSLALACLTDADVVRSAARELFFLAHNKDPIFRMCCIAGLSQCLTHLPEPARRLARWVSFPLLVDTDPTVRQMFWKYIVQGAPAYPKFRASLLPTLLEVHEPLPTDSTYILEKMLDLPDGTVYNFTLSSASEDAFVIALNEDWYNKDNTPTTPKYRPREIPPSVYSLHPSAVLHHVVIYAKAHLIPRSEMESTLDSSMLDEAMYHLQAYEGLGGLEAVSLLVISEMYRHVTRSSGLTEIVVRLLLTNLRIKVQPGIVRQSLRKRALVSYAAFSIKHIVEHDLSALGNVIDRLTAPSTGLHSGDLHALTLLVDTIVKVFPEKTMALLQTYSSYLSMSDIEKETKRAVMAFLARLCRRCNPESSLQYVVQTVDALLNDMEEDASVLESREAQFAAFLTRLPNSPVLDASLDFIRNNARLYAFSNRVKAARLMRIYGGHMASKERMGFVVRLLCDSEAHVREKTLSFIVSKHPSIKHSYRKRYQAKHKDGGAGELEGSRPTTVKTIHAAHMQPSTVGPGHSLSIPLPDLDPCNRKYLRSGEFVWLCETFGLRASRFQILKDDVFDWIKTTSDDDDHEDAVGNTSSDDAEETEEEKAGAIELALSSDLSETIRMYLVLEGGDGVDRKPGVNGTVAVKQLLVDLLSGIQKITNRLKDKLVEDTPAGVGVATAVPDEGVIPARPIAEGERLQLLHDVGVLCSILSVTGTFLTDFWEYLTPVRGVVDAHLTISAKLRRQATDLSQELPFLRDHFSQVIPLTSSKIAQIQLEQVRSFNEACETRDGHLRTYYNVQDTQSALDKIMEKLFEYVEVARRGISGIGDVSIALGENMTAEQLLQLFDWYKDLLEDDHRGVRLDAGMAMIQLHDGRLTNAPQAEQNPQIEETPNSMSAAPKRPITTKKKKKKRGTKLTSSVGSEEREAETTVPLDAISALRVGVTSFSKEISQKLKEWASMLRHKRVDLVFVGSHILKNCSEEHVRKQFVATMLQLFDDQDPSLRRAAIHGIQTLGDRGVPEIGTIIKRRPPKKSKHSRSSASSSMSPFLSEINRRLNSPNYPDHELLESLKQWVEKTLLKQAQTDVEVEKQILEDEQLAAAAAAAASEEAIGGGSS
eukprot:Rmarinus@m.9743